MRRRSLLIKLVVIVSTAWFTIAFLLYSEHQTPTAGVAMRLGANEVNKRDLEVPAEKEEFRKVEKSSRHMDVKREHKERDSAVLHPPHGDGEKMPGEMGKAVTLSANLTGGFSNNFCNDLFFANYDNRYSFT